MARVPLVKPEVAEEKVKLSEQDPFASVELCTILASSHLWLELLSIS